MKIDLNVQTCEYSTPMSPYLTFFLLSKEMVELRKTKELNDRLDLEIRALRNRERCLDAERSSLHQKVKQEDNTLRCLY